MTELDQVIDHLIEAIKNTDTYKTYKREVDKVSRFPELKEQIDIFRQRNFELQNMVNDENQYTYKIVDNFSYHVAINLEKELIFRM